MIRVFEAFAGYGSTCFALKELGIEHEVVGFSEIDKYAIQCFQQNHCITHGTTEEGYQIIEPNNFGDITKINWREVPDFDLLTGGFPCQAFSTAGKQQGEADYRGQLGLELTKALKEKQPKYFLFENVKGFMSKRFIETRERFVKSWEDAGYKVVYKVLNTKNFGIPQNRERVWFVGIRKDIQQEFVFPQPFRLELKLKDVLESNVDNKYFLRQEQIDKAFNHFKNQKDKGNGFGIESLPMNIENHSSALSARDYKQPKMIGLVELTKDVSQAMRVFDSEGIGCTLRGLGGGMGAKTGLYQVSGCAIRAFPRTGSNDENRVQQLELGKEGCANSITNVQKDSMIISHSLFPRSSITGKGGSGHLTKQDGSSYCLDSGNCQAIEYSSSIRRLTPKECFRLQGFLNDQINLEGLSDTQKYKLAGNGQSINVVKLLLKQVIEK